jgi:hypothetical protein
MRVAELSKSVSLKDLNIDLTALYRLAAPSTPPEVVEHVVALGRRITDEDVVAQIAEHEADDDDDIVENDLATRTPISLSDAEYAYRSRYGDVRQVRHQVEIMRETVVVPYYVPVEQPAPAPRIITYTRAEAEDPETLRIQAAAKDVRWNLRAIADALARHRAGAIVATWDEDDRERVRKGIEAVEELKAVLDRDNVVRFPDKPN